MTLPQVVSHEEWLAALDVWVEAALWPLGLTVAQYVVLYTLAGQAGISAAALARACLVTPETIATVLANLEAKALITRRPPLAPQGGRDSAHRLAPPAVAQPSDLRVQVRRQAVRRRR